MVPISGKTRVLALIGHPVSHSLSPAMHNAAFAADGLDFVYVCLDVHPNRLPEAVRGMAALSFRGFNITMPHKQALVDLVDDLDDAARVSGAVNTVVIDPDSGKLTGYNTDGGGMVLACEEAGIELSGKSVLLLGAGGAAAAVAVAFAEAGIGELHLANRSLENAGKLKEKLSGVGIPSVETHALDDLDASAFEADVIVNTTPLGMKEGDALPLPERCLREGVAVCDAVYRPGFETPLVRLARERDVPVVAGSRMLLYQGVLAQSLWTGGEPNVAVMDRALSAR